MNRKLRILLSALAIFQFSLGQYSSVQDGELIDGCTWNTYPCFYGLVTPSGSDDVTIDHLVTLDQDLTINKGDWTIGNNGSLSDLAGYDLIIKGSNPDPGYLTVNGHLSTEGKIDVQNNGYLIIEEGDTMEVGADSEFFNGSTVLVKSNGVLIVNGDLLNRPNSSSIEVHGLLRVNGILSGGTNSSIFGNGSIVADSMNFTLGNGSGAAFGNTNFTCGDDVDQEYCYASPAGFGSGTGGIGVLPVQLLHFTAEKNQNKTVLSWSTATETNNDYFEIKKSTDGKAFTLLTRIEGQGNSSFLTEYEWEDLSFLGPNTYYQLEQIDFDGTRKSLSIQHVGSPQGNDQILFHRDESAPWQITVLNYSEQAIQQIHILDIAGKTVEIIKQTTKSTSDSTPISLRQFRKGSYIIVVQTTRGSHYQKITI